MAQPIDLTGAAFPALIRRGRKLEYFTIVYNSLEGLIALVAGFVAGSIALVGLGFDSIIEVSSGVALLWRFRADLVPERRERVEAVTLRVVGVFSRACRLHHLRFDHVASACGSARAQHPGESRFPQLP